MSETSGRTSAVFKTGYEPDEIALGFCLAIALHALPVALLALSAAFPSSEEEAQEMPKPVIAASLLKLGKPIDLNRLPDRIVPRQPTAPKKDAVPSRDRDQPPVKKEDAGPPPPNAKDSDLTQLIAKTDPFAEDAGKQKPEEGHAAGVAEGLETDPNKVKAGDMYAALLGKFLHDRWQIPTVISQGEASRLCVTFQISIGPRMAIWRVKPEPIKKSSNDLFDDSARTMLDKLLDDRVPLPEPPPEVQDAFRNRTVQILLTGAPNGDPSRCK